MEFYVGTQFSKEFTFELGSKIRNDFEKILNDCFTQKSYHYEINKIYVDFICVSKEFDAFISIKPLKVNKKECAIEYEIKLDFETLYNSIDADLIKNISTALLDQSKEIFKNKKIKDFESQIYINDLTECLNQSKALL